MLLWPHLLETMKVTILINPNIAGQKIYNLVETPDIIQLKDLTSSVWSFSLQNLLCACPVYSHVIMSNVQVSSAHHSLLTS